MYSVNLCFQMRPLAQVQRKVTSSAQWTSVVDAANDCCPPLIAGHLAGDTIGPT
jgi:hypothetical protein